MQDKFFDVAILGPKHAIVIGYGGKILDTKDGGFTWTQIDPAARADSCHSFG